MLWNCGQEQEKARGLALLGNQDSGLALPRDTLVKGMGYSESFLLS